MLLRKVKDVGNKFMERKVSNDRKLMFYITGVFLSMKEKYVLKHDNSISETQRQNERPCCKEKANSCGQ